MLQSPGRESPSGFEPPSALDAVVPILRQEDIVIARQIVREAARDLGLGMVDQTRIATVLSELVRNVLNYAGAGECRIRTRKAEHLNEMALEVEDAGPGIADIAAALQPGFSTGGGYGLGLPTVKKLAESLTIESRPGRTLITVVFKRRPG
jgi:serine/threonine-protein kinase RsbT